VWCDVVQLKGRRTEYVSFRSPSLFYLFAVGVEVAFIFT
jgi:hypothetical protein